MLSQEVVLLPPLQHLGAYKPDSGQYGFKCWGSVFRWYHCREVFHSDADYAFWQRSFYFSCAKEQREAIAEFIDVIEGRLGLKVRTKLHRTNIPTALWVRPAPFWHKQLMRYSLFTILLRVANSHVRGNDISIAYLNNKYLSATYRAFTHFMSGRTRYTGWTRGWMNAFADISCCKREKCLHVDRRCRRRLDALLVPSWQVFPIYYIIRLWKWGKRSAAKLLVNKAT